MTIPEEIELLKIQLEQITRENADSYRQQAELLLNLVKKCAAINSGELKINIDHLLQLAGKLDSLHYKAWGLLYLALFTRHQSDYPVSIDYAWQALTAFNQLNETEGVAIAYRYIGIAHWKQCNYTESLKNHTASLKLMEKIANKAGIADAYTNLGLVLTDEGQYNEALNMHSAALKLNEEIGEQERIGVSLGGLGTVYFYQANYPQALNTYFAAAGISEKTGDKYSTANHYSNIGIVYERQGNYPEALKYFLETFQIRSEINDKEGICISLHNIGLIYSWQGNHTEALKNYRASMKLQEEMGHKNDQANSYSAIGGVYEDMGNYDVALENHQSCLKLSEEIGEMVQIAATYNNMGRIYEKLGNYPLALKNHQESLQLILQQGNPHKIAVAYRDIGSVYAKQNNYAAALQSLLSAFEISSEKGDRQIIKDSSNLLAGVFKATGDFENALKYHEKYHQVESEMLGEESKKQLNNLSFMHNLEQKEKDLEIEQLRNVELKKERDRSESLLLNILPSEVAGELKEKGSADAKLFEDVTVLFTDFKGFTTVSEKLSPQQLVDELNTCFSAFDHIISKYNIEKIKTVGDAYLAVSGLPLPNINHAEDLVKAAIEIREYMINRRNELNEKTFEIRIGVHSGGVVAGIVGVKKFAYDIWGDTVNTAARMEQNSEAGKINISQTTYELVKDKFKCEYRGEIEAKNKGLLKMYFVE